MASTSLLSLSSAAAQAPEYLVYVGTYTRPNASKGIYAYRFQPATGKMTPLGLAADTPNPAFLVAHPNGRFLYADNVELISPFT